jgi:hypothetical protein
MLLINYCKWLYFSDSFPDLLHDAIIGNEEFKVKTLLYMDIKDASLKIGAYNKYFLNIHLVIKGNNYYLTKAIIEADALETLKRGYDEIEKYMSELEVQILKAVSIY